MIREALNVEPKVWARYGALAGPKRSDLGAVALTNSIRIWQRENGSIEWYVSPGVELVSVLIRAGLDDKAIENKVTELVKATL